MTITVFERTTRGAELLLELRREEFTRGLLEVIAELAARIERLEATVRSMIHTG